MSGERGPLPEEEYSDMVDLEVTENAAIRLESDLLRADISTWDTESLLCGVDVTRDGRFIALGAGTLNESEPPHLYAWCELTPEQARVIGDALHQAADDAEDAVERSESQEDSKSFLRRLLP